jgi:hypothetical protein
LPLEKTAKLSAQTPSCRSSDYAEALLSSRTLPIGLRTRKVNQIVMELNNLWEDLPNGLAELAVNRAADERTPESRQPR